jgi:hypothetical protein
MFRAMFSPIIRSTWLYLQYLLVFTQVAAGWCPEWVETELCRLWDVYYTPYNLHSSVLTHSGHQPAATWVNTNIYCKYSQVLLMMGEKNCPKHVEPTWNNKLIHIMHLVGYFRSCITMHGFMNVKFAPLTRRLPIKSAFRAIRLEFVTARHHVKYTCGNERSLCNLMKIHQLVTCLMTSRLYNCVLHRVWQYSPGVTPAFAFQKSKLT